MDKRPHPGSPGPLGLSLPASLRWLPSLLLLAALLAAALVACGDGGGSTEQPASGEAAAGAPGPTPDTRTQGGAELTTEEYAQAMEEIAAGDGDDEIEAAGAALLSGDHFSRDEAQRFYSLETSDSWSDDDAEFASDVAETMLQAVTGFYDVILSTGNRALDEMSGLRPPEHLSDLHETFIATAREVAQFIRTQVDTVKNAGTEIRSREELADFLALVNSLESGSLDPQIEQKGEELAARGDAACLALREQLELELERDVGICGAEGSAAGPRAEPPPTAASTPRPATTQTRESVPAPGSTSAETDREALVALYHATGGPSWTDNTNWLSDEPLAEWHGVEIDAGRVFALELQSNGLKGEIPPELGQLSDLAWLNFYDNELSGHIPPELARLSYLVALLLDENDLSGEIPPELGQLSYLEQLGLYSNNLTGSIPAELAQLSYLYQLDFADNNLSGEIPGELGQLTNLDYLDLSNNDLTGEIPGELGQLSKLEFLGLSDNDLTREIPAELGQLSLLTGLYLSGNQLSGCIPEALGDVEENDLGELGLEFC